MTNSVEVQLNDLLPAAPLQEPVLASCGAVFSWGDVVDWMADQGTWAEVARRAAEGMTLAAAGVGSPSGEELRREAERFRRARRLVAGDDLLQWLAHWSVSEGEWVDWLDRTLRREAGGAPRRVTRTVDEQATWVEAVCSGEVETAAAALARGLGAWAERTGGAPLPDDGPFAALRDATEELERREVAPEEVDRAIATNAAGWVQVTMEWADFTTTDAAREAVASVRDDGMSLAGVAQVAGVDCDGAVLRAAELDARTRAVAVSAPLDSPMLVGAADAPGVVAVVRARRYPGAADADDRALAVALCREERAQSAMDRWVTWRV